MTERITIRKSCPCGCWVVTYPFPDLQPGHFTSHATAVAQADWWAGRLGREAGTLERFVAARAGAL